MLPTNLSTIKAGQIGFVSFPLSWMPVLIAMVSLLFGGAALADDAAEELKEAKRELEGAFARDDGEAMASAVRKIGRIKTEDAIETLCMLDALGPRPAYLATAQALADVKDKELVQVIVDQYIKASKRRHWARQIMLIDALADDFDGAGLKAFESAVEDRHPKVRLAAIRAIASTDAPTRKHVELLIESIRIAEKLKDVGTPHLEARQALNRFTQQFFKPHKEWASWFKDVPDDYQPTIKKKNEDDVEEFHNEEDLKYYEVPVTSRRMLFIIDTSGSMSAPMKVMTDYGNGDKREEDTTRMKRAKQELSQLLLKLPPYTGYNVISFSTKTRSWKKSLMPWSKMNVKSSLSFTDSLKPEGATSAKLALTEALEQNVTADTIYFLTDGGPTDASQQDILIDIEKLNRFLRVKIHTIGFGSAAAPFLSELAKQNNGKYQEIVAP